MFTTRKSLVHYTGKLLQTLGGELSMWFTMYTYGSFTRVYKLEY